MSEATTYNNTSWDAIVRDDNNGRAAIVIRGIGGDPDVLKSWVDGLQDDLISKGIWSHRSDQIELLPVPTFGGRVDAVFYYDNINVDMGKFAMWRLQWAGQVAWLEDYIVNDASAHGMQSPYDDDDYDDDDDE